jgi:membrane-bound lytic murein transglycosylase D
MYGLKQNWWYDGRRDIVASTHAALAYLESLHKRLDGDWLLALAAYNSGAGNVWRAIRKNRKKGLPTDFWHLDLPDETRAYVPKLLAISKIIADPQHHNITLKPILNEPRVVEVETDSQIDLALVAKLADISIEEVYRLNPAFNHWATTPDKQHTLLIPVEKENLFKEGLAKTPKDAFIQWQRHKIQPGETLSHIAKRYHTTVKLLSQVNHLNDNRIRQGKHLLIPVAQQTLSEYSLTRNQRMASRLARKGKGQKRIITVDNGDTFWDLSRKYKVSVRTLAKWNGMAPADTLKPGKKLVLWTRSGKKAASSRAYSSKLPVDTIRTIHYTVRRGDSLARISNKFKVTVKQLRKWNRLPKGKYLQPGQRLKLIVDVTQQT